MSTPLSSDITPLYRSLNGDDIRLVRISSSSNTDTISCQLYPFSLKSAPVFFALSYVWGDPLETTQIRLGRKMVPVTNNLKDALQRLPDIYNGYFWIDALCIDQSNESEKDKQFQRLHEIYGKAKKVIAWLGPGSEDYDLAMKKFKSAGEQRRKDPKSKATSSSMISHSNESKFPFYPTWALLQLPFWRRVWIAQEICSPHSILFVCGQHSIEGEDFLAAYDRLDEACKSVYLSQDDPYRAQWSLMKECVDNVKPMLLSCKRHGSGTHRLPLNTLLRSVRGCMHASDPKYMIYAFLKMASDSNKLKISIDKKKGVWEVYTDATVALIKQGNLDLISESEDQTSTRPKDLPYWVPDFLKPSAVHPFVERSSHFSASASTPADATPKYTRDSKTLSVFGVQFGEVGDIGRAWNQNLGNSVEAIRTWIETFEKLSKKCKEESDEARWSTPIARSKTEECYTKTRPGECKPSEAYSKLLHTSEQSNGKNNTDDILRTTASYRSLMNRSAHMRRGFVAEGRLGLGPEAMKQGDVVCILFGAKVPHILRKLENDSWKVIGDAYVFELMDKKLTKSQCQKKFKLV